MIGQKHFKDIVELLVSNHSFPRFSIITGPVGSGKKTMCDYVCEVFKKYVPNCLIYKLPDVKIDSIREMTTTSYQATQPMIYIMQDADNMSVQAKNSLLKVTEEPPNNAYFLMTLESADFTLDTIRSRATIYNMDNYTQEELKEYAIRSHNATPEELTILLDICNVPGDVDMLYKDGPKQFYDYVVKVVDNIAEVEGSNVFKISDKLAVKQDSEGYDVKLFLRTFMSICVQRMKDEPLRYATAVSVTSKYMSQLGIRGISKQMLLDNWMLEIRKYWLR